MEFQFRKNQAFWGTNTIITISIVHTLVDILFYCLKSVYLPPLGWNNSPLCRDIPCNADKWIDAQDDPVKNTPKCLIFDEISTFSKVNSDCRIFCYTQIPVLTRYLSVIEHTRTGILELRILFSTSNRFWKIEIFDWNPSILLQKQCESQFATLKTREHTT